ncbi:uncharacterized protein [Littorina saxatilis]|uniref:uncharacterized protein isoform X1 n=1 Tax=Littorina saxatilis TaxID=31220 RepID=UPI0038B5D431
MGLIFSIASSVINKFFVERPCPFEPQEGITLYDNALSPCARRVRMALLEKKLLYRKVEVNLLKGEQLTSRFKRICPNKKVPAIAFRNVPGLEQDCTLYESNVITEFLDSDIFPGPKLYPVNAWERAQVKMWQDWELGLVDDFVPFVYANMIPFILQLIHSSKESFLASLPKEIPPAKRDFWSRVYDASTSTPDELKQHAIMCYKNLTVLEKALNDRPYLVGNDYTAADLSVLPRVEMYNTVGLYIPKATFPNIVEYLHRLEGRKSTRDSQRLLFRLMRNVMGYTYFTGWVVKLGNWRSGRHLTRFDGSVYLEQTMAKVSSDRSNHPGWRAEVDSMEWDCVLVADCPCCPRCWQVKLLLLEKGVDFKTYQLPVYDVVGRWAGSGGLIRIYHKGHEVVGIRAVLDYVDACFVPTTRFFSETPLEKARVQCWQAWDQTMGYQELAPLLEMKLISLYLVKMFSKDLAQFYALGKDPMYESKFPSILQCFVYGLLTGQGNADVLEKVEKEHREVVVRAREVMQRQGQCRELLRERLKHLESHLHDKVSAACIQGKNVSVADVTIYVRLSFMWAVGGVVEDAKCPTIASWFEHLEETRPHFLAVSDQISEVFNIK